MRRRLQYVLLFISVFFKKHRKELIIASLSGFFMVLFLIQAYPLMINITGQKRLKIGIVGKVRETNMPDFIQKQISFGLTSLNIEGEAIPAAASSWDVTDNAKTYTFHIRKNLLWHDGKEFTTQDINYKLKDAEITKLDDYTLKITLRDPYVILPVILSQPIIKDGTIGLGGYKVIRLDYDGENIAQISLQSLLTGYPSITYKFYPNINQAILAFKLGEVNVLKDLVSYDNLDKWAKVKINITSDYNRFVGLFFNLDNPLFKVKEIRQALAYGLPKFDDFNKAFTPISPLSWGYSKNVRLYNSDEDSALKILSKSPLATSSSVLTISTYPSYVALAEEIAESWNKFGLTVKVKVENTFDSSYQIFLMSQPIPPDPDQYSYWQSTQENTNITHYNNPKIDKLLEEGRKTLDKAVRKKIYFDFQRYLVDDLPVIFLYYPKLYQIERL